MRCSSCGQVNPESSAFCNTCGTRLTPAQSGVSPGKEISLVSPTGYVGRQRELADLNGALDEALSGHGRLVMLVGEPGIGKTRLAQELASVAEDRGAQVLWGRCYEDQGMPPYWPWTQAMRFHIRDVDHEQLREEMGSGAPDIAEVIPDLWEQYPNLEPPPHLEPEQARFRLFNSIATFLKNAAQIRPMVLVMDDLHWADTPSLAFVEFLSREIAESNLLVIGTYRDMELSRQHPLSKTLGGLARERLYQRIPLKGLDLSELGQLIQATADISPSPDLIRALQSHAEGNPFFAIEVVRLLAQEGDLTSEGSPERQAWGIRIPEGVREVIGLRLDRLTDLCNQTLTMAAVLGREFSLEHLKPLIADQAEDRLLEVLEEALQARVIDELPIGPGQYQFTHALIQETLAAELSLTRRVRLHAQIAEELETLYGVAADDHAAKLAHHFAEAEAVIGADKLIRYSLIAGERALATYAWEEAEAHFERALLAKGVPSSGQSLVKDEEAAMLLFGLARAQVAMLQRHEMTQVADRLSRAFDYYADVGDLERAVEVAGYPYAPTSGQSLGGTSLIARALRLVPSESQQAGGLLSRYGLLLALEEGDYIGAQEATSKSLSIAERERDTILEMQTMANAARADRAFNNYGETLLKSLRAIELASEHNEPLLEVAARYEAALVTRYKGDLEGSRQHAAAMLEVAEQLRDRFWLCSALNVNAAVCHATGDWQSAGGFSDRSLEASPGDSRALARRIVSDYQVGDFDQGSVHLERLIEIMGLTTPGPNFPIALPALVIPLIAEITGQADRMEIAEAAAQAVLSYQSRSANVAQVAMAGLGLLAVMRSDADLARRQYVGLLPVRGTFLQGGVNTPIDRLLGLMAQVMGDPNQAQIHFEDALVLCRKGFRPDLAWICCDYADTLLNRNESGDQEKAISLLEESLSISTELGMPPLMERVRSKLDRLVSLPAAPPAYPDGLTLREVEVLNLISQGKSNRGIGEDLVISEGTVRRHVSNIYDKIGVANRAEATRYALEHELVTSD